MKNVSYENAINKHEFVKKMKKSRAQRHAFLILKSVIEGIVFLASIGSIVLFVALLYIAIYHV
jgi:hypothetical protein